MGRAAIRPAPAEAVRVLPWVTVSAVTQVCLRPEQTAAANVAAPARARTVAHQAAPSVPRPAAAAMPAVAAPRMNTARSSGRRTILEQELNTERTALAAAQQALVSGRAANGQADAAHQARVRQLESAVLDRQQNIQALQRELSRM